jgi:hypothetical protein
MDAHSLVVQEPHETLLEDPFRFGCRPVDHLLIGSRFDEPLDPFWAYIYRICDVPEARIFSMLTSVDQIEIRPYINAGFLVIKPEAGVLNRWFEVFAANFNSPKAHAFYEQDALRRVFMHQAVLSGVVMRCFKPRQIKILPMNVNIPLHLFEDLDEDDSDEWLDQMVTIRYDVRFEEASWLDRLPLKSGMKAWLRQQWGTEVST